MGSHCLLQDLLLRLVLLAAVSLLSILPSQGVTLEQIISREHPYFDSSNAYMTMGRDGKLYFSSVHGSDGAYLLRTTRDGTEKFGNTVVYATANGVANTSGIVATANGHFNHAVNLYTPALKWLAANNVFLANDMVGWNAPIHVEAGASGDFYAVDQHRTRILRVNTNGEIIAAYNMPGDIFKVADFRVLERTNGDATFVVMSFKDYGNATFLHSIDFTGGVPTIRWSLSSNTTNVQYHDTVLNGGFDIDSNGNLYTLSQYGATVQKWDAQAGTLLQSYPLIMGEYAPATDNATYSYRIGNIRIWNDEIYIKRTSPTELFQAYNLTTGALIRYVPIALERLQVTYPAQTWAPKSTVPFTITFTAQNGSSVAPQWKVWMRPLEVVKYQQIPVVNNTIQVPADYSGLYVLKVTPELDGWQRNKISEYQVRDIIEVRNAGASGTISMMTTTKAGDGRSYNNRVYYQQGEEINCLAVARAEVIPPDVKVRLLDEKMNEVANGSGLFKGNSTLGFTLPGLLTSGLAPGMYTLIASAGTLSSSGQHIVIGAKPASNFFTMQYADYGLTFPSPPVWDSADIMAQIASTLAHDRYNLNVDRLGAPAQNFQWDGWSQGTINTLLSRLKNDATATTPEKATPLPPIMQYVSANANAGVMQMGILTGMDASLPVIEGVPFDYRSLEKQRVDLTAVTQGLLPFAGFRGWTWASGWWVQRPGASAAPTPEAKAAYDTAVANAKNTGAWDPIIDQVSDIRYSYAVDTQQAYLATLRGIKGAGKMVSSVSGAYRNMEVWPPTTFRNVDEVDLQAEFEQIAVPYHVPFQVDYYSRPGKPSWVHPEIWNDSGTGDQILPALFMAWMRGVNGTGYSYANWTFNDTDPRVMTRGTRSVRKTINSFMQAYGPWMSSLLNHDPVALIVSSRQTRIDEWPRTQPKHFSRLMEAYLSLWHAQYPAKLVFTDDLTPNSLNKYKAVVLADQWVELEPALSNALLNAQKAGVRVFYDGTCRANLMTDFTPLGISFDKLDADPMQAHDDAAYLRFANYIKQNEPAIIATLHDAAGIAQPIKVTDSAGAILDEVLTAERVDGEGGRVVTVVNNTTPTELTISHLWRISLFVTNRVPIIANVNLGDLKGKTVYDIFAQQVVTPVAGVVSADLRSLPCRSYAILPSAIDSVELSVPGTAIPAGRDFIWKVRVLNAAKSSIAASIPLRLRLIAPDGVTVLQERFTTTSGSAGASGVLSLPRNLTGVPSLEAAELCSARSHIVKLPVTQAAIGTIILDGTPIPAAAAPMPATATSTGKQATQTLPATEKAFGPHLRGLVLTADGTQAVMTAANWDHNLYSVDLANGAIKWRAKAGQYFTFDPKATEDGIAVQGFNFNSAEGYGLYLVSNTGKPTRRFDLYGLPKRLTNFFLPGMVYDQINNFAVAKDGRWVASAGDLGLAVWSANGTLRWKQDWYLSGRHTATLGVVGSSLLLVANGATITAYHPENGTLVWQQTIAPDGTITKMVACANGSRIAVASTYNGGAVQVLDTTSGMLVASLPTAASTLEINQTGSAVAITDGEQLKYYTVANGLQWLLDCDGKLDTPRFSADGQRLAVTSDAGTLSVLNVAGSILLTRDLGSVAVAAWHADGDLIIAGWDGNVRRINGTTFAKKWSVQLSPAATDIRSTLMASDNAPVTRISGWSNADAVAAPLTPNLLTNSSILMTACGGDANGVYNKFALKYTSYPTALLDGDATPPKTPWLAWDDICVTGFPGGINPQAWLEFDTFRTWLSVTGITIYEDPAHPESWLRDARLDVWDAANGKWLPGPEMRADAAAHTHTFKTPLEGSKFRIFSPNFSPNNFRAAEVVFHGKALGASHPDVRAGLDTAVLYDENNAELLEQLAFANFLTTGAYSGTQSIQVQQGFNNVIANDKQMFGSTISNWNFVIKELPQPGEYRFLHFAWKATKPGVKGIALRVSGGGGDIQFFAGVDPNIGYTPCHYKVADTVPTTWTAVTVDLWDICQQKKWTIPTIQSLAFGADSEQAAVALDRVLLSRTATANEVPVISLVSPLPGTRYLAPGTIMLQASASDIDGTVSQVEFFNGATSLGVATKEPFTVIWIKAPAGEYSLTAKATDNGGASRTSFPVSVVVNNPN